MSASYNLFLDSNTATTVTVSYNANPLPTVLTLKINYTAGGTVKTVSLPLNENQYQSAGLLPATSYTLVMFADNVQVASIIVTTFLLPDPPNLLDTILGDKSVTLTWDAVEYPISIEYQVYFTTPSYTSPTYNTGTTTEFTAGDLGVGELYTFYLTAVVVEDGATSSATVTTATAITYPGVPPLVTVTALDQELDVSWDIPFDGGDIIMGYTVYWGTGNSGLLPGTDPTTYNILGLANGTEYTVTVTATNAIGEGPPSEGVLATPRGIPGTPPNLTLFLTTSTMLKYQWDPADPNGADILEQTAEIYLASSGTPFNTWTLSADTQSWEVSDLLPNTSYRFTISATNVAGTGSPNELESTTLSPPPEVTDLQAVPSYTSVTLSWDYDTSYEDTIVSFSIIYGTDSVTVYAPQTSVDITGLQSSTPYTFTVFSETASGSTSPVGAEVSTTTLDPVCYGRGTRILCDDGQEMNIEDITAGMSVKIWHARHTYRTIHHVYKSTITNNPQKWRSCMYRLRAGDDTSVIMHGTLTDDLWLTGGHSIVLSSIPDSVRERQIKLVGAPYFPRIQTHELILVASLPFAEPCPTTETFDIYHLVLDSADPLERCLIWANGILSESLSLYDFKKLSIS